MEERRPKNKGGTSKEKLRKGALNVIQKWKKKPTTSGNNYCPHRDFAQKAKSRGGTLVTHVYIKESTYN